MNIFNQVRLKDLTIDDLDIVLRWRNQDYVRSMMFNSEIISKEEHYKWFDNNVNNNSSLLKVFLYNDKPYGFVQFYNIDTSNNTCEWSFYIGERNAPKGMGSIMGVIALNFIFKEHGIRKLCAQVIGVNKKSYKYHMKLGFNKEGCLKKQIIKHDIYQDVYMFALFNTEWEILRSKFMNDINKLY